MMPHIVLLQTVPWVWMGCVHSLKDCHYWHSYASSISSVSHHSLYHHIHISFIQCVISDMYIGCHDDQGKAAGVASQRAVNDALVQAMCAHNTLRTVSFGQEILNHLWVFKTTYSIDEIVSAVHEHRPPFHTQQERDQYYQQQKYDKSFISLFRFYICYAW